MNSRELSGRIRKVGLAVASVLFMANGLFGQVQVGDNLALNLNGNLSTDYTGSYGNEISSAHSFGFGGTAGLTGSYYSPNFLSFDVNPFFNQSRANSNFGSLTNATGVTLSSGIFSGSHFPGTVNFSKVFNKTGNYGLPGISSFDTNSNAQSFAVNWSAILPKLPSLNVGYQRGNDDYSLYGTNENGTNHFHNLFLNSNYNVAGFGLGGGLSTGASSASIPQVIAGGNEVNSTSNTTSYNLSASHALPWRGTFSNVFSRSDVNSDYLGYRFDGTIDRWAANAGVHPTEKLSFSGGADYTDNLSGSIYQATVPGPQSAGASASSVTSSAAAAASSAAASSSVTQQSQQSNGWNLYFLSTYSFAKNLQAQGEVERRTQFFQDKNYGSTLYSGGLYYTQQILGGYFGSSFSLIDSRLDNSSQNTLGFTTNTNYSRRVGAWQFGGYFNYSQNVQTLLVSYTTSFYNFSGNVRRNIGPLHWTASAAMGKSGLTALPGTSSHSESFSTSLGTNRMNLAGSYSKADGNSLAGGAGLVPVPVPPIIPSSLLVMYGGESYSVALSGSPMRHLTTSASYVKARNTLNNQGGSSWNNYEQQNYYFQYHFRQINLTGGYARLVQGFSASGIPPANISTFSVGLSRWFNFF
jgi:hypothetical protein